MLELLYRLFIGHNHKWLQIERIVRTARRGNEGIGGLVFVMQCEVCGKIDQVNID